MENKTLENRNQNSLTFSYPIVIQILLGLLCGCLNIGANYLQHFNPVPLYMDTIFTITASFFGAVSGVISALVYHISTTIIYAKVPLWSLVWGICSLTIVLIIRIYIHIRRKIEITDLVLLVFVISLVVSLEGSAIFTVLNVATGYREDSQVKFMYALLSSNSISIFVSALLPRVPVNILDKAISTCIGWLSFKGISRLLFLVKKA